MTDSEIQPRPRGRGRPPRKGPDVGRRALVEAARRLLTTVEPPLMTRQMVAEEAGVDPNLIRYYFGNMQQLIEEVIASAHRRARAEMAAIRDNRDPLERLRYRIRRSFRLFYENPNHHKLVATTLFEGKPSAAHDEWIGLLTDSLAELQEILALGAEQEIFREVDARLLHMLIISACEFWGSNLPVVRLLFGADYEPGVLEERYIDFIFDTVMSRIMLRPPSEEGGTAPTLVSRSSMHRAASPETARRTRGGPTMPRARRAAGK